MYLFWHNYRGEVQHTKATNNYFDKERVSTNRLASIRLYRTLGLTYGYSYLDELLLEGATHDAEKLNWMASGI